MAAPPLPPPTDLTGVCFRNQWFLSAVGGFLSPLNVFDYFAGSPFYDPSCTNEQLRLKGLHPLDSSHLRTLVGWEYALHSSKEPLLFVLKKQKRESSDRAIVSTVYYVLDGSIYQAPTAHAIISARIARSLHHLSSAFNGFRTLLHDKATQSGTQQSAAGQSLSLPAADALQTTRTDIILHSALQRLPPPPDLPDLQPAPPPAAAAAAAAVPGEGGRGTEAGGQEREKEEQGGTQQAARSLAATGADETVSGARGKTQVDAEAEQALTARPPAKRAKR